MKMGKVRTIIKLTNFVDKKNAENNLIPVQNVRTIEIEMLADTGATMLVIGEDIAKKLGIEKESEIWIKLADDSIQRHYKGKGILVEFGERDCVTDCVILEKGVEPILGQIPLEEMDLLVDCKNQKLIPNPESPDGKTLIMVKKA